MTKKQIGFVFISMALLALGAGCKSSSVANSCADNPSSCSAITPESFVTELVQLAQSGQIASGYANTTITKLTSLQPGYFVIWNGNTQSYEAVELLQSCDSGTECSNSNSQAAALTFVKSANSPIFEGEYGTNEDLNQTNSGTAGIILFANVLTTNRTDGSNEPIFQSASNGNIYYSAGVATKDVDLQRAQVQNTAQIAKAAAVSSAFQMDFQAAMKITQLSDRIQAIGAQNITAADRSAILGTMMGITGVSQDELNQTVTAGVQGNDQAVNTLLTKISQNLGMPSATVLRDRLLPALGVNLNQ